jgi:hypothetical protein
VLLSIETNVADVLQKVDTVRPASGFVLECSLNPPPVSRGMAKLTSNPSSVAKVAMRRSLFSADSIHPAVPPDHSTTYSLYLNEYGAAKVVSRFWKARRILAFLFRRCDRSDRSESTRVITGVCTFRLMIRHLRLIPTWVHFGVTTPCQRVIEFELAPS